MPPRNQARMGLLDSVIILILGCMLALILLWISAQLVGTEKFEKLPDWLTKAASSIWTYLTGVASSSLLALVRRRSGDPGPNYLLWIFGTAIVMLMIVFGLAAVLPPPDMDALLKFSLRVGTQGYPILTFSQRLPKFKQAHNIAVESNGLYQLPVNFPGRDGRFYARAVRAVTTSQETNNPLSPITDLCFKRNPKPPGNNAPLEVWMDCSEGERCSISREDPGWAGICSEDSDWRARIRLVPVVYADAPKAQPGWKVPSLETLRKMPDRERVGYTEFSIESRQLGGLREADSFQYLIKVNGSPVYVDGWAPEDMLKTFDAARGFTFSFGLENLNFSGADNGCENLEVELRFRQGQRVVKKAVISRKYAALRDAVQEEVKAEDGTTFIWGGKYVKPKNEDRTELFVLSTPDLQEAKAVKARIDAAKLSYDGRDVVGVLRPPLDNPEYGIVVGLSQPTGQIRFTYDTVSAQKLRDWTRTQRTKNRSVFRHDTFFYQMRPGAAGAGQYRSCSAAARK